MTLKEEINQAIQLADFAAKASATDSSRHFNEGKQWALKQALKSIEKHVG